MKEQVDQPGFMPLKVLNWMEQPAVPGQVRLGFEIYNQLTCNVCRKTFHKRHGVLTHPGVNLKRPTQTVKCVLEELSESDISELEVVSSEDDTSDTKIYQSTNDIT